MVNNVNNNSSNPSLAFLNAMIGDGGIEKLEKTVNEIEEQSKQIEEEIKNYGKKKIY
ncbi:MAG: hypothetical protein KatS3mg068_1757 [Candidatus Sericytochromatia bacterium]|nr:MAG: hypothetical protein KatS3mg068_1757 [Candidatus Sericytochromatia bacterium]